MQAALKKTGLFSLLTLFTLVQPVPTAAGTTGKPNPQHIEGGKNSTFGGHRQVAALKQNATVPEKIPQDNDNGKAREKAGKAVGVNERYVSDAKRLACIRRCAE
ncbi:hypothetical protein ACK6D9_11680 [Hoeflea sp. Naph1]|uniref:hypothetical protein n=1 Tax=Hoeflea sp. Naph1 TaxID=3388653 RepID=UPI00399032CD